MAENKPIEISEKLAAKCNASDQFERFDAMVGKILSVPRATILERADDYAFHSAVDPNRRGPKRKRKPLASPGTGASLQV
jgi:hypothetical protein